MRTLPAGTFERLTSPQSLWAAWGAYARRKRRVPRVARFDLDADRHTFALHRALRAETWRPGSARVHIVRDPKPRPIVVVPIADGIVHQALWRELGPFFVRRFSPRSS